MSDKVLKQVAEGQPNAVAQCLEKYGALVWGLARRSSENHADAEDAVQEAFIEIWKHAERYNSELGSEAAFITTIVRRRLIDRTRKRGRRLPVTELLQDVRATSGDVESEFATSEESQQVHTAMQQLKTIEQEVLKLALLDGCTQQEISDCLDLPLGTVKSHARRGIQRLREILGPVDSGRKS